MGRRLSGIMKKKLLLLITIFSTYSLLLPLTNAERRAQFHQERADRAQAALDRQARQEAAQDENDEAANDEEVVDDEEDNECFISQREAIIKRRAFYSKLRQVGDSFIPLLQGGLRAFQCYYTYRYVKDTAKLWKQPVSSILRYNPAIGFDLLWASSAFVEGITLSPCLSRQMPSEKANLISWNLGTVVMGLSLLLDCGVNRVGKVWKLDKQMQMSVPKLVWHGRKELMVPMLKAYIKNQSRFLVPHMLGTVARYNLGSFVDIQLRNDGIFTKPSWRALLTKNGLLFATGAAAGGYFAPKLYRLTCKIADAYSSAILKHRW